MSTQTSEACYSCPIWVHTNGSKAFSCTVWGRFTYPWRKLFWRGGVEKNPRKRSHILSHAHTSNSMQWAHLQCAYFWSLLYTSVESNKFQRLSSIFHDLMDLIWLVRHPQISRNDEKSSGMPISERHPGTHTTGEVQQSTEYAHTEKISKVVTGSIPAWSQSLPSFVTWACNAKKSWSEIWDDVIIWRQLRM